MVEVLVGIRRSSEHVENGAVLPCLTTSQCVINRRNGHLFFAEEKKIYMWA
jgi:hypothetical protein